MDFEVVVGGKGGDGGVESWVVGDGIWDLVLYETLRLTRRWASDFFISGGVRRRRRQKLHLR